MKRRIVKLCVFVLALLSGGAIINVAVAWGIQIVEEKSVHRSRAVAITGRSVVSEAEIWWIARTIELRSGFPVQSMQRNWFPFGLAAEPLVASTSIWETGLELSTLPVASTNLPVKPIWPGFAINTVFYAAVLWVLFAAPGFIRRRIRARRDLCPACAYPIGESAVCTECGTPVRRSSDFS